MISCQSIKAISQEYFAEEIASTTCLELIVQLQIPNESNSDDLAICFKPLI
jgi:hypothetical protein